MLPKQYEQVRQLLRDLKSKGVEHVTLQALKARRSALSHDTIVCALAALDALGLIVFKPNKEVEDDSQQLVFLSPQSVIDLISMIAMIKHVRSQSSDSIINRAMAQQLQQLMDAIGEGDIQALFRGQLHHRVLQLMQDHIDNQPRATLSEGLTKKRYHVDPALIRAEQLRMLEESGVIVRIPSSSSKATHDYLIPRLLSFWPRDAVFRKINQADHWHHQRLYYFGFMPASFVTRLMGITLGHSASGGEGDDFALRVWRDGVHVVDADG